MICSVGLIFTTTIPLCLKGDLGDSSYVNLESLYFWHLAEAIWVRENFRQLLPPLLLLLRKWGKVSAKCVHVVYIALETICGNFRHKEWKCWKKDFCWVQSHVSHFGAGIWLTTPPLTNSIQSITISRAKLTLAILRWSGPQIRSTWLWGRYRSGTFVFSTL